jgi:hypothetical protein
MDIDWLKLFSFSKKGRKLGKAGAGKRSAEANLRPLFRHEHHQQWHWGNHTHFTTNSQQFVYTGTMGARLLGLLIYININLDTDNYISFVSHTHKKKIFFHLLFFLFKLKMRVILEQLIIFLLFFVSFFF